MLELSTRARKFLDQPDLKLQIILEIDGFEDTLIFGAVDVEKFARIGEDELTIGEFFIGGTIKDSRSRPWISAQGTTTRISQQVLPDKEGTTSVQKLRINLIDKEGELTRIFSPGVMVPDLLGLRARVFTGFSSGAHPNDSIRILSGTIDDHEFGAGWVKITIAHPEGSKKQTLFPPAEGLLASGIMDNSTVIALVTAKAMPVPGDCLRTFVKIGEEIIEYTQVDDNFLLGLTRGALGTTAAFHTVLSEVVSFVQIQEEAVYLALKLLLSGGDDEYYVEDLPVAKFVQVDSLTAIPDAILIRKEFRSRHNVQVGDLVTVTDSLEPLNNVVLRPILAFGETDSGFYMIIEAAGLLPELSPTAKVAIKSQWNVLSTGCGMIPDEVDIERFLYWQDLFGDGFPEYFFDIRDSIDAKEFLDKEVYFPAALYCVPRKGRTSVQMNIPPLAVEEIVRLNEFTVCDPKNLTIERSVNQFFYNAIDYAFDYDVDEDKFLRRNILVSQTSLDRIKVGLKKLTIESKGLRTSIDAINVIETSNRRYLDRYRFGAERLIGVSVLYKVGLPLEIGDAVVLEGAGLQITDSRTASRRFSPRLMEVVNKEMDYAKGKVNLDLLDTAFELDARYGVIGPSSFLAAGSTTTKLKLARSFGTLPLQLERDKWAKYIGETLAIRDDEFNLYYERTIVGLDPTQVDVLIIAPALPVAPAAGMVVDMPVYSGDIRDKAIWKNLHVFVAPEVTLTGGVDNFSFTVDAGDIDKFFVGGQVRVHDDDYTILSPQVPITGVDVGTLTITVGEDLTFTPAAGQFCNPIGFADDQGLGYNYL